MGKRQIYSPRKAKLNNKPGKPTRGPLCAYCKIAESGLVDPKLTHNERCIAWHERFEVPLP